MIAKSSELSERWIFAALFQRPEWWPQCHALEAGDFSELHRPMFAAMLAEDKALDLLTLQSLGVIQREYLADISGLLNEPIHLDQDTLHGHIQCLLGATRDKEALQDPVRAVKRFEARCAASISAPRARRIFDLQRAVPDDPNELLMHRYLCRGGMLLLCAPSGVGKSVLVMQAMMLWALGRPLFEITPARPLKSLLIQSEDDDGDLSEMRDGVCTGLALTEVERKQIAERVLVDYESKLTGTSFLGKARSLLREHQPDMLIVNPVLAYLGGATAKQEDVGPWLRNGLNPLLNEFQCGGTLVHHTNKPPRGEEKAKWSGSDLAYLGSGSIEWANVPRSILALQSVGEHDRYKLVAAKRGQRLGWKDEAGDRSFVKWIGHSPDPKAPFWIEVDAATGGRPKAFGGNDLLALLPPGGLEATAWQVTAKRECGISPRSFYRLKKDLLDAGRIAQSSTNGCWQPVKKNGALP